MYWSYLTNTVNTEILLTFESNNDYDKLCKDYCELIIDDFFSSFTNDYDAIFISEFEPTKNPSNRNKRFFIKFNDVKKATNYLKNSK
jgi:hypothetical protein